MPYPSGILYFDNPKERLAADGVRVVDFECRASAVPQGPPARARAPALAFVRHGAAELWVDDRRALVDPSQAVLLDQGTSYRARHHGCRGGACATVVQFDEGWMVEAVRRRSCHARSSVPLAVPLLARSSALAYAVHVLLTLSRPGDVAPVGARRFAADCARLVWVAILDGLSGRTGRGANGSLAVSELARRAREVLARRAREPIGLSRIAREIGCSRYHLCRVFRTEIGLTTNQYLHRVRISEALYRLAEGEEDLLMLALDLGYAHHSHFTSVFHRLVGIPPSKVCGRVGLSVMGATKDPSMVPLQAVAP